MKEGKGMSKGCMVAIAVGVIGVLFVIVLASSMVSTLNTEARLRTAIEAKQKDNTSEFDNMWKKLSQVAQVPEQKKNALMEIFNSHAESRSSGQKGGSLALWIKESVPNVDLKVYDNLQNIIISSRDRWTMRQKELVDLERERTQMFRTIPSSVFLSVVGRREGDVKIVIVTSDRTDETFKTGKDNDIDLFKNK
jgi:hypothetical protein